MKTLRSIIRKPAAALAAALVLAPGSAFAVHAAGTALRAVEGPFESGVLLAQGGGCYGIAQQIASQHGGTVASADPVSRGGQTVCVIVVIVPAKDGKHGRRLEFTVPAN